MQRRRRPFLLEAYRNEIEKYCMDSGLSVEKVFSAGWSQNYVEAFLLCTEGIEDAPCIIGGPPCPIMLAIHLEDGKLRFEQTEHTYKLYDNEPVREAAFA